MINNTRILIVSSNFYPMNTARSLRTTELALEFANKGHEVTVITPKDEIVHSDFEQKFGIRIMDMGQLKWKPIELKGNGLSLFMRRIIRRGTDLLLQYPDIELMLKTKRALIGKKGYDLLISVAVPHPIHWGVAWAWNNKIAKTWVADCGDPFMGAENDTFKPLFYFGFFERWFLKKAHFITVPVKEAINAYHKDYRDKIKVIPQGFTFPKLAEYNKNRKLTFIYAGSISPYMHYARHFFDYLKKTQVEFKFIVYTKEREIYEYHLGEIINKIEFNEYIDRIDLLPALSKADFLVHFPYAKNSQQSLKLIDYHHSGRPILSYEGQKDDVVVDEFFQYNFNRKLKPKSTEKYRIENVCHAFLELTLGRR